MTWDCPVLCLCWLGGEGKDGGNEREMDNTILGNVVGK